MKKTVVFLCLLLSAIAFSQFQKVELTDEEMNFLAIPKVSMLGEQDAEALNRMLDLNNTIFMVEIKNGENLIYRGTMNKWYPADVSFNNEITRTKFAICLKYSDLNADQTLRILENYKWESRTIANQKAVCTQNFEVFKKSRNSVSVNQIIDDLEVKV